MKSDIDNRALIMEMRGPRKSVRRVAAWTISVYIVFHLNPYFNHFYFTVITACCKLKVTVIGSANVVHLTTSNRGQFVSTCIVVAVTLSTGRQKERSVARPCSRNQTPNQDGELTTHCVSKINTR